MNQHELPPDDYIMELAHKIIEEAQNQGIILRLIGSTAFRTHCPAHLKEFEKMARKLTDIDTITYSSVSGADIESLFTSLGLKEIQHMVWHATTRRIFYDEHGLHIDVFYDKLDYCHTIDFKKRLELDYPTIPLAEMLLEKMQIVEINEKDLKDSVILLTEHAIGDSDDEQINGRYISQLLSGDWGFYYTVKTNLEKVKRYSEGSELPENEVSAVRKRIDELTAMIDTTPKSRGWKLRARIGIKKKWYKDVGDIER
ncbi:MAG: hypothetical protein ACFFBJ_05035 [Promethearchaeota archaeon]